MAYTVMVYIVVANVVTVVADLGMQFAFTGPHRSNSVATAAMAIWDSSGHYVVMLMADVVMAHPIVVIA